MQLRLDQGSLLLQLALAPVGIEAYLLDEAHVGHHQQRVIRHEGQVGLQLGRVLLDLVVAVAVLGIKVGEYLLHEVEHRPGVLLLDLLLALGVVPAFLQIF